LVYDLPEEALPMRRRLISGVGGGVGGDDVYFRVVRLDEN
jgi:hypothetical protein